MGRVAALALAIGLLLAGPALAEARFALVIGNEDYPAGIGRLSKTHEDAGRVAAALRAARFEVEELKDQNKAGMDAAIAAFLSRAEQSPGAVAFFYYSGHGAGLRVPGQGEVNVLVPAKEAIAGPAELALRGVRLDAVIDGLAIAGVRAGFVVSDACRNELALSVTKGGTKGFAPTPSRPGVLVAYATAAGATTPDDGLFSQELARQIGRAGQDAAVALLRAVQAVADQREGGAQPFLTSGRIPEDLCFVRCEPPRPTPVDPLQAVFDRLAEACEYAAFARDHRGHSLAGLAAQRARGARPCDEAATPAPEPAKPRREEPRPSADPAASALAAALRGDPVERRVFRDCADCPEMVAIPGGSFTMGSPAGEKGRDSDEGPQRTVTIPRAFAVGKFEVTWDEWEACVRGGACDQGPVDKAGGDNGWGKGARPVISVSWNDAKAYVRWLSAKTGQRYRLLSEAEWEYAARAGGQARWSFGDDEARLGDHAWHYGNSGGRTQPVGGKAANAFGLHDMHGNVWEWVEDCYADSYSAGQPSDGSAYTTPSCSSRGARGGSWLIFPSRLRSASRYFSIPSFRLYLIGFRLARTVSP